MKRAKPDAFRLAVFLAIKAEFGPQFVSTADDLWQRWRRYARKRRVSPGTPRSFGNALRNIGCPWSRPYGGRTRWHTGMRLAPDWWPETPPMRVIEVRNRNGQLISGPMWHADSTGQPLIYVRRGLTPGRWVPARIIWHDKRWWAEPIE
jgi:hypothetical protein